MNIQKTNRAFTLIELLVGIAIISIMLLGTTQIDFNRLNARQELELLTNKIKTNHEMIRNDALSGKGIGVDLVVPDSWSMDVSIFGSGTIVNSYSSGATDYNIDHDIIFKPGMYISKVRCLRLDGTEEDDLGSTLTGSIEYNEGKLSIGGDCTVPTSKKLEITVESLKGDKRIIEINSINGLAEILK